MKIEPLPRPLYEEPIVIRGGPWKNDCTGRADIQLLKPVKRIQLYTGSGRYWYERTDQKWVSPVYGTVHTIFVWTGEKCD